MNELIQPGDEQKAVWKAEHISRRFEDGDEVFAVDEAQTIVMEGMYPGYDLKSRALTRHTNSGIISSDIMAYALGLSELSGRIKHILLMDQIGTINTKLVEERARQKNK